MKIGIIGAMDVEVNALREKLENCKKIEINKLTFYEGTCGGKELVIVKSGIGKVNAALCVQILVDKFGVSKVINSGIAGATGDGLKIYDFVISTEAVYHDFDTQFFGYKLGQVPGMPERFTADIALADAAERAFGKTTLGSASGGAHKVVRGLIASGDQFIAGGEKKDFIVSNFHPQCVEMEGCAIAHACYNNNVPFVIIRCMSDTADDSVKETYSEETAAALSIEYLTAVIREV